VLAVVFSIDLPLEGGGRGGEEEDEAELPSKKGQKTGGDLEI